jgi:hypothetical protein
MIVDLMPRSAAVGNATPSEVLSGYTFSTPAGTFVGTMPNNPLLQINDPSYGPGITTWQGGYYPEVIFIKPGQATYQNAPTGGITQMGATLLGGLVYSVDGQSSPSTPIASVWVMSYFSRAWAQIASDTHARTHVRADSDGSGSVYAFSNQDYSLTQYSEASGAWVDLPSFQSGYSPTGTEFGFACAREDNILVADAFQYGPFPGVITYSIASGLYSYNASQPRYVTWNSASWYESYLLYIDVDGYYGGSLNTVLVYSLASASWTSVASDPQARDSLATCYDQDDNIVFACCGENSATLKFLNLVETYSYSSNAWTQQTGDAYNRQNVGAAYIPLTKTVVLWDGEVNSVNNNCSYVTSVTI